MKSKPIKLVFDKNYHSDRNTLWSLTHHSQVKQERRKASLLQLEIQWQTIDYIFLFYIIQVDLPMSTTSSGTSFHKNEVEGGLPSKLKKYINNMF